MKVGADVTAVRSYEDRGDITALHLAAENAQQAAENHSLDAIHALLDSGTPINAQDSLGFTPLHLAVQYGFYDVCRALIAAGCSIKHETISGLTPVRLAEQMNDLTALTILKDAKKERKQSMKRSFRYRPSKAPMQSKDSKVPIQNKEITKKLKRRRGIRGLLCGFNKEA